jgi:hypothetical protein
MSSYKQLSRSASPPKKNIHARVKKITYQIPVNLYTYDLQLVAEERRLITATCVKLMALPISTLVYCNTPAVFTRKYVDNSFMKRFSSGFLD